MTTLLTILTFSVLFVCWGLMRPADQRHGGCHTCPSGNDPAGCGESCALFEDLESKPKVGVER